jgi:ABC-type transport system involved in cytochrome c biogenesis permease subunit
MIFKCFLFVLFFSCSTLLAVEISSLPVSEQGRFRPLKVDELSDELKMIPSKRHPETWLKLETLKENTSNPSLFSDGDWAKLKEAYTRQNYPLFASTYFEAYVPLTGQKYFLSKNTSIKFPSENQLKAELWYSRIPLASYATAGYLFALLFFLLSQGFSTPLLTRLGAGCLVFAFICHTALIAAKIYILERPPVSNMADTLSFVPWIAVILATIFRNKELLAIASGLAAVLLAILEWTLGSQELTNVQAVLNSRVWLIIHVLMVVSSYGVFILAGILGHVILVKKEENKTLQKALLQLIYLGIALLIPGTILGGIWASMSWGRFWDWDPKESWAFVSACIYLIALHAYRFHYIGDIGLAAFSIAGLIAISFTWYGVNYILGTGLHSYGFGSGGEWIYFTYVILEGLFLAIFTCIRKIKKRVA